MDIWRWVQSTTRELRESGQARLADLIDALPTHTCDDEHARVEALCPEALALARAARLPWVELFIRHWRLQSRVFHRYEVKDNLPEAVDLLDFASRDEARGCPQSVCVTQDIAGCYSRLDGPGYVDERLAVAAETLERIDPTWPCFSCISREYAGALFDDRRFAELREFAALQTARGLAARAANAPQWFVHIRAMTDLAEGRPKDALALLEGHAWPAGGEAYATTTRLLRARALAELGRPDEALAERPDYAAIEGTAEHYDAWARATLALARAGAVQNDAALGRQLRHFYERFDRCGANHDAAEMATLAARAAAERGARRLAEITLEDAQTSADRLRRPARVRAAIAEVRALLAASPDPSDTPLAAPGQPVPQDILTDAPPASPDPAAAAGDDAIPDDPERALDHLARARADLARRLDGDGDALAELTALTALDARALGACGHPGRAVALLQRFVADHPGEAEILVELAAQLAAADRTDDLRALVDGPMRARDDLRAAGLWRLARHLEGRGELALAEAALADLCALDPEADPPLARRADLLRRLGRHGDALAALVALAARSEPGNADWDLMTEAAIVGRHDLLRDAARRLGFRLDPAAEGPIDGDFGLCRVRIDEPQGPRTLYAERRGPVTARILEIVGPGADERLGDLVAFDAAPIDTREQGDGERVHTFAAVATLARGGAQSFALDGPHPGADALAALRAALAARGGTLQVRSGERYRLHDAEDDERELPGLYAFLAAPSASPAELHALLAEATAAWPLPVVWLELAGALPPGDARDAALAAQSAVAERFGI